MPRSSSSARSASTGSITTKRLWSYSKWRSISGQRAAADRAEADHDDRAVDAAVDGPDGHGRGGCLECGDPSQMDGRAAPVNHTTVPRACDGRTKQQDTAKQPCRRSRLRADARAWRVRPVPCQSPIPAADALSGFIPTRTPCPHSRRSVIAGAAVTARPPALAQTFPQRPITLVVPFAAGGSTDVVARIVAQKMTEGLGQQVIVENVAGAGGNVGAARVAKADPTATRS